MEVPSGTLLDTALRGVPDEVQVRSPRRSAVRKIIEGARKHADSTSVDGPLELVRWTRFFKQTQDGKQV